MNDRTEYFEAAASWALDTQLEAARSRKLAWRVAGAAAAIACLEAVALAMLAPLKTVQPITLLVDRQTGYATSINPDRPRRLAADEALIQAFLAQYVMAREGFDRATISADYRKVALWSSGAARAAYLASMPAANPASPFNRYPVGTVISARVKSVSKLGEGSALVRFDTLIEDQNGRHDIAQPWIATLRYRFVNAPMSLDDRLVNPLGFQILSYRRDLEAVNAAAVPAYPAGGALAVQTGGGAAPVSNDVARGLRIANSNIPSGSALASPGEGGRR